MTRQGWCLVVLAVMAGVGCWLAGQAGAPQLSALYVEYELPERNTTGNPHRDDADGTVEVLRQDGDR